MVSEHVKVKPPPLPANPPGGKGNGETIRLVFAYAYSINFEFFKLYVELILWFFNYNLFFSLYFYIISNMYIKFYSHVIFHL